MDKIVLATRNQGKKAELEKMLGGFKLEILTLADFPDLQETEETGASFMENALLKANECAKATGLASIADDSGLIVNALGNLPGIYSARFADDLAFLPGENRDQRNIRKLLNIMKGKSLRDCKFVSAIVAAMPDGQIISSEAQWKGVLLESPKGGNGFGYDPVFFDTEVKKSAAEMSGAEKNLRSHRGLALRQLMEKLPEFLNLAARQ